MDTWEVIWTLEESQCSDCRFRKSVTYDGQHAIDFPMCYEVEGNLIVNDLVDLSSHPIDRTDDGTLVCTKYRPGDPDETFGVHPEQPQLFEENK